MDKKFIFLLLTLFYSISSSAQLNTTLLGHLSYTSPVVNDLSNIGGYVDTTGNEYAIIGTYRGTSIVDVSNPSNPLELFLVPSSGSGSGFSSWREVKTSGHYAYVTTEAGGGLQIIDLSALPLSYQVKTWTGDGAIAGQLSTIHALHVDSGFVYLYGSNIGNRGIIIADISDPWNPTYAGMYTANYVHDGYVRNNIIYACEMYNGTIAVIDVSNKAMPVVLASFHTPTRFPHNSWLSDDGLTLYTTDEFGSPHALIASWDISDLQNIRELDRVFSIQGGGSVPHNVHVLGDYLVTAYYTDGITIHDASDPENLIEVGNYDTNPASGLGVIGAWGVYPFLPSGNILISDIDSGLFIISANFVKGCYLNGQITDSITGMPIGNAKIEILGTVVNDNAKTNGYYKTGWGIPGTYDIRVSKAGYKTKIVSGLNLASGVTTLLDVQLEPSGVGMVEQERKNIKVYPNPFSTDLTISGLQQNEKFQAEIMDTVGRVALSAELNSNADGRINWTTGELSSGLYVLRLTRGDERHLVKVSVK